MPRSRIVIVTGANRGIGNAICRLILSRPNISPLTLYATSRKGEDLGLDKTANNQDGNQLRYPKLDIAEPDSISEFVNRLRGDGEHVDVLINNAGLNLDKQYSPETAKRTLDVNYRGTLHMCQALMPLLSRAGDGEGLEGGRIVNLSSVASGLKLYSEELRQRFRTLQTLEQLEQLAVEYEAAVREGQEVERGWPSGGRSYAVSKACVNAFTRVLARENADVTVNACCPGWIDTDMGALVGSGALRPPKTVEEGARIPVALGFGPLDGVSGAYWANDSLRSKGEGKVQEW